MGRTYYPNKESLDSFDVNSAGTNILSIIVKKFDLPKANYTKPHMEENIDPPWKASSAVATEMGNKLKSLIREEIIEVYDEVKGDLFDGTAHEFVEWVRRWQKFLLECNGYQVP